MIMRAALAALFLSSATAEACDTALVLAIDVSSSIDVGEYRIQVDGLARALRDPEVVDALVLGQTAVAVMQWSGVGLQEVSIPWVQVRTPEDAARIADQAAAMRRAFVGSNTAVGDALRTAARLFDSAPDCARRVIDISGDGTQNAGTDPAAIGRRLQADGITVNGLAIESIGLAITGYYKRAVITRDGFVITARGHNDYLRAIREKIKREVSKILG